MDEEARSERHLARLARIDALTGLLSRGELLHRLERRMAALEGGECRFGLLFCDVDHFKEINDRYGHARGDAVLREISARMRSQIRGTDLAGRLGGDEFLIVLEGTPDLPSCLKVAEKVRACVEEPLRVDDVEIRPTLSVGVALQHPGECGGAMTDPRRSTILAMTDPAGGRPMGHALERHNTHRVGWLRAVVLGANDGTISVASLAVGIAASGAARSAILLSAIAATVAGAMSMAAGEFVSVQSQADTEEADLAKERRELVTDPAGELAELIHIYVGRGLDPALARQVAEQLTLHDALGAHARDELGITEMMRARPVQAALASAGSFAAGSVVPLLALLLSPQSHIVQVITATALAALVGLGGLAAWAGGASLLRGALRMLFWGALAMGLTALAGRLFGAVV